MCGIAGLVYESSQVEVFLWEQFGRDLEAALSPAPEQCLGIDLGKKFQALFETAQGLKEFSAIRVLGSNPAIHEQVQSWARELASWEARVLAYLEEHAGIESRELEEWNGLLVQVRDLLWAVREDVLAFLPRLDKLLSGRERTPERLFQAWKLVVALENISRMEVRGRDSCGLCCRVSLPEAQYKAFLDSLSAEQAQRWQERQQPQDFVNRAVRVFSI